MKPYRLLVVLLLVMGLGHAYGQDTLLHDLVDTTDVRTAYNAAEMARQELIGLEYDWVGPELAHCSGFVSRYLEYLGFPTGWVTGSVSDYDPQYSDPVAFSGTAYQAGRLELLDRQLGGGFSQSVSILELITNWSEIVPVGGVVYLETAVNHNGFDAISHVGIHIGATGSGQALVADFAAGMHNGPMFRPMEEVIRGVYGADLDLTPSGDSPLMAHVFDVLAMVELIDGEWTEYFPMAALTPVYYRTEMSLVSYNPILGFPDEWQRGGAVAPNSVALRALDPGLIVTVNLNDGTTTLWDQGVTQIPVDQDGHMEAYSVIGRLLKVNPELTTMYAESEWSEDGSRYDGEWGVWFDDNGIPRTTYTPLLAAQLSGFGQVDNFGLIGGSTNIAFLNTYIYEDMVLSTFDAHSHYTIHRVPQDTPDQDVLLREPDLIAANSNNTFGALSYPTLNRSSGCVNYDAETWIELKAVINPYLERGELVIVMFVIPGINQDLIIRDSAAMVHDPLSNYTLNNADWGYNAALDRRGYYTPQVLSASA